MKSSCHSLNNLFYSDTLKPNVNRRLAFFVELIHTPESADT